MGNNDKLDYILATLDLYLKEGKRPIEALEETIADYAFVFFHDDGRLPLGRAAKLILKRLREKDDEQEKDTD